MKFIWILLLFLPVLVKAQQSFSHPGLGKFAGTWRYINGQDTILMKCEVRYVGGAHVQIKGIMVYYTYTQGNTVTRNNFNNSNNDDLADFGGTKPRGINLDTLKISGEDILKRKIDEGYFIINGAGNQLQFVRDIGISGGGIWLYKPGEQPLPGFTLPDGIIFTKFVLSEEKNSSNP